VISWSNTTDEMYEYMCQDNNRDVEAHVWRRNRLPSRRQRASSVGFSAPRGRLDQRWDRLGVEPNPRGLDAVVYERALKSAGSTKHHLESPYRASDRPHRRRPVS